MVTLTELDWRLAEALQVQKMHGDRAPLWIANRIGELIEAGDNDGAKRWLEIATVLSELMYGTRQ